MPDDGENAKHQNTDEEKKKDPVSFLHEKEQEKVRKLVLQYQKIGETEVGVQTEFAVSCKDVAIQKDEEKSKCDCHDMLLDKVTNLENKIEELVSAIAQSGKGHQPGNKISEDIFSCTDQTTCSFDSFDEESSVMQTISEVASIVSNQTLPGMVETSQDEIAPSRTASNMMSPSVYDELFKKSLSIPNYAKNLVFAVFEKEELIDCNCSGAHEKKSLESDPRMDLIKETTFKKFPTEDRKKSWAACRKAIDSAIRKLRFKSA